MYLVLLRHLKSALSPQTWNRQRKDLNIIETQVLSIQLQIFSQLVECCDECRGKISKEGNEKLMRKLDFLLGAVLKRQHKISAEEVNELNMEVQRFRCICKLLLIENEGAFKISKGKQDVSEIYKTACQIANSIERFTDAQDTVMKTALEKLIKLLQSAVTITEAEKREIVLAMSTHVRPGAWYKCPKGHIYAIGNCGQARQLSRCPECGAAIGGNYGVLPDNQVATEMIIAARF